MNVDQEKEPWVRFATAAGVEALGRMASEKRKAKPVPAGCSGGKMRGERERGIGANEKAVSTCI